MKPRIEFDALSGVRTNAEAMDAMRPWLEWHSDAGALHSEGVRARDAIADARRQVCDFIGGATHDGVIFTSSGTEATNLAVKGCALASVRSGRHIVASVAEHPAVLQSLDWLATVGFTYDLVGVDGEGRVSPDEIAQALRNDTMLVCVQVANQDIGSIQPLQRVVELSHARGVPVFADATYAAGWMPIDAAESGVDMISLAPYRFGGPKGVGVLYKSDQCRLQPLIHGGVQENARRAGSENVAAIVGAGVAAEALAREGVERYASARAFQRELWEFLRKEIPYLRLNGPEPGDARCPLGLNVSIEFVEGEGVVLMSDVRGLAISSGSACLSRKLNVSHVLEAIGVPNDLALGSIILSPGLENGTGEMERAVSILKSVVERLRSMSPDWEEFQAGRIQSQIVG